MDSWFPFEFVCEWVRTFDVEFDNMFYRDKESAIIKRYKNRLSNMKQEKTTG